MGLVEDYAKYLGGSNRLLKDSLEEAKKVLKGASDENKEKIKYLATHFECSTKEAGQSLRKSKNPKKTGEGLKEGKGTDFGMLSVKAGIDNNPKPTQADRIAGATKDKKKAKGGVRTAIAKIKSAKDGARTGVRGTGAATKGFRKARLS